MSALPARKVVPRPSTAPASKKDRTPFDARPLGRMVPPQRAAVPTNHGNQATVIATLKGDVLALQRRLDHFRAADLGSIEMEDLEQHLLSLNAAVGNESATLTTINTLLELLMRRVSHVSAELLKSCGEDISAIGPGRTAGFVALLEFVNSIAARKQMWEAAPPDSPTAGGHGSSASSVAGAAAAAPPAQSPKRQAMDDALNEPTVSQLRRLIAEQRTLQATMAQQVRGPSERDSAAWAGQREQLEQQLQVQGRLHADAVAALHAAQKEANAYKRRLVEAETDLRRLRETEEDETDANGQRVGAVAFAKLDRALLDEIKVDVAKLTLPTAEASEALGQRVADVIREQLGAPPADGADGVGRKQAQQRRREKGEVASASEGSMWAVLQQQNALLAALAAHVRSSKLKSQAQLDDAGKENTQLRRVVAALDERVRSVKSSALRGAEECHAQLSAQRSENDKLKESVAAAVEATRLQPVPRVVNVKNQPLSFAQREQALQVQNVQLQQCVAECKLQLGRVQQAADHEATKNGALVRERNAIVAKLEAELQLTRRHEKTIADHEAEVAALRGAMQGHKKDLREKTAAEADVQQHVWKLEVEQHIAQNVITELRQREEALQVSATEAQDCQALMATTLKREREGHASGVAQLKGHVRAARAEEEVARQVLKSERTKMLEHEKEVERLRALDLQMDVLEQNFTNYAACKLAQREAVEEEERVLQGCVDTIGRDVFVLPATNDSEEKVELYADQLRRTKANFDAEERTRKRQKATAVNYKDDRSGRKQLAGTMQQRYNNIQIFACDQRSRQMALERESTAVVTELGEYKTRQESLTVELSHAKMQCDSLVQRNTELELQRKDLTRARAMAEQDIKLLKNNIHRMRMASEEQEKLLIDVGTKLQQSKGAAGLPISTAVME
jgi:hypothetical protein